MVSKSIKNANMNYSDRNSAENFAEDFFEEYCKDHFVRRLGFDEKNDPIPDFYNINPMVRNLPDYFVYANKKTFLCNVKGTDNFKQKEVDLLENFKINFSSEECPLLYAFCFYGKKRPIFQTIDQLIERYELSSDSVWPDGVVYRNLGLRK